jgi:hypothetical protein
MIGQTDFLYHGSERVYITTSSGKGMGQREGAEVGCIRSFSRNICEAAKPDRIRKIQGFLDTGRLKIRYAPFVSILFEQAEHFLCANENCTREDVALDVLSSLLSLR